MVGIWLLHGRMYVTPEHVCFDSNVFGVVTRVALLLVDVVEIREAAHHLINQAIVVVCAAAGPSGDATREEHLFASFNRDQAIASCARCGASAAAALPHLAAAAAGGAARRRAGAAAVAGGGGGGRRGRGDGDAARARALCCAAVLGLRRARRAARRWPEFLATSCARRAAAT